MIVHLLLVLGALLLGLLLVGLRVGEAVVVTVCLVLLVWVAWDSGLAGAVAGILPEGLDR